MTARPKKRHVAVISRRPYDQFIMATGSLRVDGGLARRRIEGEIEPASGLARPDGIIVKLVADDERSGLSLRRRHGQGLRTALFTHARSANLREAFEVDLARDGRFVRASHVGHSRDESASVPRKLER